MLDREIRPYKPSYYRDRKLEPCAFKSLNIYPESRSFHSMMFFCILTPLNQRPIAVCASCTIQLGTRNKVKLPDLLELFVVHGVALNSVILIGGTTEPRISPPSLSEVVKDIDKLDKFCTSKSKVDFQVKIDSHRCLSTM